MKINFDQLETEMKNSPNTTISSLSVSLNYIANSKLPNRDKQIKLHQKKNSNYQQQYQSRLYNKSHQSYASLLKSTQVTKKIINLTQNSPKKFAHTKTIQEMKEFIEAMNEVETKDQQIYFQKQKKGNQNNLSLFLKDILQPEQHKKQQNQIQLITDRLYYQSERKNNNHTNACCKRKQCKAILTTTELHQNEALKHFTGQPQRIGSANKNMREKLYRSLQSSMEKSVDSSFSTQSNYQVYLRLHEDSKIRAINSSKLKQQIYKRQHQSLQLSRVKAQNERQYTKNYRGFYQRLDQLVKRQNNRSKYYDQLNLSSSGQILFQPNHKKFRSPRQQHSKSNSITYKELSKKLVILSKKNLKCSKFKCHQDQQRILQESKKTQEKFQPNPMSIQIIQEHEKKFLSQMKTIFYDKTNQKIKINQKKVAELGQKEFEILFELISKIQHRPNKIKNEKMLQKQISAFYKNLDTAQRQQLRRLNILKVCRTKGNKEPTYRKIKQSIKSSVLDNVVNLQRKKNPQQLNRHGISVLSSSMYQSISDYCQKLSDYV